jgi:hypothetical protein
MYYDEQEELIIKSRYEFARKSKPFELITNKRWLRSSKTYIRAQMEREGCFEISLEMPSIPGKKLVYTKTAEGWIHTKI